MSFNGNDAYSKVLDTIHDSQVLKGLANNQVLPRSLRIIKARFDATGGIVAGNGYAFLDRTTGKQVLLNPGEQILYASFGATTTVTTGGVPTFDFGLSPTAANGISPAVTTLIGSAANSLASVNAGITPIPASGAITIVGASNVWLAVDVNTAALLTGVIQAVIIVV
jgi:hypothetical protein